MTELVAEFEKKSGHKVAARFELNPAVKKLIEQGEPFDVVVVNPEFVEELTKLGKVRAATDSDFGRIPMGVAIKPGVAKPDLRTVESFKGAMLAATAVAYAARARAAFTLSA